MHMFKEGSQTDRQLKKDMYHYKAHTTTSHYIVDTQQATTLLIHSMPLHC